MRRLVDNPVRRYAWGSVDAIPRLLGTEPDGRPQAELWLGAHERGTSSLSGPGGPGDTGDTGGTGSLLDAVSRDPERELGPPWAAEGRMPFLAKVIATARPLSLQVHPGAECAARWFAAEEERGVDRDARERSCPDAVAKGEMVWALSQFEALCGFRRSDEAVEWLETLDVAGLKPTAEALRMHGRSALQQEVRRLLRLPAPTETVAAVAARAGVLAEHARWSFSAGVARDLAERYPHDPAVALALLLQPVVLSPGQAMFVRPGQPHTYLRGTAFEVQANSDNVLRAGLTDKHVDVDLLSQALDTTGAGVAVIRGVQEGCEQVFAPDTARFALSVVCDTASTAASLGQVTGPQVFLCVDGEFMLESSGERLVLRRGASAYLSARAPQVQVQGRGTLLRVTTGRVGTAPGESERGSTGSNEDGRATR
jgi:mannose-6-phosphate isomerase